jgi:hypothetical protein
MSLSRREVLRLAAAAAAAPLVPGGKAVADVSGAPAAAGAAGRFFGAAEMALLDELCEIIVPADEHSGGARAAGVAAYVDARLAEYDPEIPELRETRSRWKAGLAALDALARESAGRSFLEASPEQRVAVLQAAAAREADPQTDVERFFVELKRWTTHGYYTSRIGLQDELEYKGNTLLAEFVGADPATLPPIRPRED